VFSEATAVGSLSHLDYLSVQFEDISAVGQIVVDGFAILVDGIS
jgi:hypothetical protein